MGLDTQYFGVCSTFWPDFAGLPSISRKPASAIGQRHPGVRGARSLPQCQFASRPGVFGGCFESSAVRTPMQAQDPDWFVECSSPANFASWSCSCQVGFDRCCPFILWGTDDRDSGRLNNRSPGHFNHFFFLVFSSPNFRPGRNQLGGTRVYAVGKFREARVSQSNTILSFGIGKTRRSALLVAVAAWTDISLCCVIDLLPVTELDVLIEPSRLRGGGRSAHVHSTSSVECGTLQSRKPQLLSSRRGPGSPAA